MYHICNAYFFLVFTNIASNILIEDLARADAGNESVKEVQEFFMDYYAVNPDLITLNTLPLLGEGLNAG